MSIAIAFMFKPGHFLETESVLLAASIRSHAQVPVALHAFHEASDAPFVTDTHRDWFSRLDVTLREIRPEGAFRDRYPQGNKLLVCASPFDEERVIFLDSDMILTGPTDFAEITHAPVVAARALAGGNWGNRDRWARVYDLFGVDMADIQRLPSPKGPRPAYYNAGMVSFETASGFGRVWLETAQRIDRAPGIRKTRPWLDQVALPVTPHAGGPQISLPRAPLFNKRPTRDNLETIRLAHYTQYCLHGSGLAERAEAMLRDRLGLDLADLDTHRIGMQTRIGRARTGDRLPFVKIYGERNTGTNLLEQIVETNYDATIPRTQSDGQMALNLLRGAMGSRLPEFRPVQDFSDRIFLKTGLGWKHGSPPLDVIETSPYPGETLFLVIYKDPFFWLKSIHRRPYNPLGKEIETLPFGEFIRAPFPTSRRDRVALPADATPLQVYQAKLRACLDLKARHGDDVVILPYERMIADQKGVLAALGRRLRPTVETPAFPEAPAKRMDRGEMAATDYLDKYAPTRRREGLDAADVAFIEGQIDADLYAALDRVAYDR